jgi:hypothetical protein
MNVICRCADTELKEWSWASNEEITQFLREVLLSYRLLFAQCKESRRMFRNCPSLEKAGVAKHLRDPYLLQLCGRKSYDVSPWIQEKHDYCVEEDFPILCEQILALRKLLEKHRARGWMQLWRNRQYTEQWYAFWAILIIGILGLLLSLLQTILQAMQVYLAFKVLNR